VNKGFFSIERNAGERLTFSCLEIQRRLLALQDMMRREEDQVQS